MTGGEGPLPRHSPHPPSERSLLPLWAGPQGWVGTCVPLVHGPLPTPSGSRAQAGAQETPKGRRRVGAASRSCCWARGPRPRAGSPGASGVVCAASPLPAASKAPGLDDCIHTECPGEANPSRQKADGRGGIRGSPLKRAGSLPDKEAGLKPSVVMSVTTLVP